MSDEVDVAAVVAQLREEVDRRRAAGEYDERALQALREEFGADLNEAPEAVAYVAASRPLGSARRRLGPAIVFSKRVVRRLLSWYVAPIAEDQTRFNIATIRLLRRVEQRIGSIEAALGVPGETRDAVAAERPDAVPAIAQLRGRVEHLERLVDQLAESAPRSKRG